MHFVTFAKLLVSITLFGVLDAYGLKTDVAVEKAISWILDQRQDDLSWGEDTPRALIAHELWRRNATKAYDVSFMAKSLNVLTAVELLKERDVHHSMSAEKLAHFINALLATCQNPRNFHGRDLVSELRQKSSLRERKEKQLLSPYVYLTLCLNGNSEPYDAHRVESAILNRPNYPRQYPGIQAIGAMALMCLVQKHVANSGNVTKRDDWNSRLYDLFNKTRVETETYYLSDVYITALTLQMVNCAPRYARGFKFDKKSTENLKQALLGSQLPNGSFGDFLSTYLAVPALLETCLLDLKHICNSRLSKLKEYGVEYTSPNQLKNVTYSLWINNGDSRVKWTTHSRTFSVQNNYTLFDVMNYAKTKSDLFDFSYDDDNQGKHVYSIAGLPNDSERNLRWKLFINNMHSFDDPRLLYNVQEFQQGLDRIQVKNGDSYVFMFSSNI